MDTKAVQFSGLLKYSTVQYSAVKYSAAQYSALQCSEVQGSVIQCSAVQSSAVQCSAVLWYSGIMIAKSASIMTSGPSSPDKDGCPFLGSTVQ